MIDGGRLEIEAFAPCAGEVDRMDMDEFVEALAKARVVQDIWRDIFAEALHKVLGKEQ